MPRELTMPDWRTLPAGRALDALVAERVFGAMLHDGKYDTYMTLPGERPISDQRPVPAFSTDIADAMRVVEQCGPFVRLVRAIGINESRDWLWRCELFTVARPRDPVYGDADTAPLAICRAALAAVEVPHA